MRALETKVGSKTIDEQFREQAELIDRLFVYRFEESDRKWEAKLETKFEEKLAPIKSDIAVLKTDVAVLKTDVAELKADVAALKADVAELKIDVASMKTDIKTILERLP